MKTLSTPVLLAVSLLSLTSTTHAQQTFAGSWSNTGSQSDSPLNPIIRPTDYSTGSLSVGANAYLSATLGHETDGTNQWGPQSHSIVGSGSGYISNVEHQHIVGKDTTFSNEFSVIFDTPLDFGPDSAQDSFSMSGKDNYIHYGFIPLWGAAYVEDASIVLTLTGGATFSDITGSYGMYQLLSGGVGYDYATFGFDETFSGTFNRIILSDMKVSGSLESITASQSITRTGDFTAGSGAHGSYFWFSQETQQVPEPSAPLLIGVACALTLLRRRRSSL